MTVKCYMKTSDMPFSMGWVEISCSEMMAQYLESQTDDQHRISPIHIEDETARLGFRYDNSRFEMVEKIVSETMDIGDYLIYREFSPFQDFYFERKDYDFCYEKTVLRVEDNLVFMRANSGKEFAVKMNDYLYLNDKPKAKDIVSVTKFNDGKSFVTEIIEKWDEEEHKKRAKEQRKALNDLMGGY